MAFATQAYGYASWYYPNTLGYGKGYGYGYGYNPYGYQQPKFVPSAYSKSADADLEELQKVRAKVNPVADEAFGYMKGLLPSGRVVKNGQIYTSYGNFAIPKGNLMSKADRQAIVPVLEAVLAVMKQDTLNDADMDKLMQLSRDLSQKLPNSFDDMGIEFDF